MSEGLSVKKSRQLKLGLRLFFRLILVICAFHALFTLYEIRKQGHEIRSVIVEEGQSLSEICSTSLKTAVFVENIEVINSLIRGVAAKSDVSCVEIIDNKDATIYAWAKNKQSVGHNTACGFPTGSHAEFLENDSDFNFQEPIISEIAPLNEELFYIGKVNKYAKTIGYVRLSISKKRLSDKLKETIIWNILAFITISGIVALAIYVTVMRISHPIELQISQIEKMDAITTLAQGIAHDIGNVGGTVRGYLFLMKKPTTTVENRGAYIVQAESALNRITRLVRLLLAFGDPTQGTHLQVNINNLIKSMEVRLVLPENIEYVTKLCEAPITILGSAPQMEQVIMNLCLNAKDAIEDAGHGCLVIATAKTILDRNTAQLYDLTAGEYAEISVEDTGVGIDTALLSKIFNPFFTTKDVGKGTGLGLSIVYSIVKEHSGAIYVDSIKGKGTTVHIFIPLLRDN